MARLFMLFFLFWFSFQGTAQQETRNTQRHTRNPEPETQNTQSGIRYPVSGIRNQWSFSLTPIYLQSREEILQGKRYSSFGIMVRPEWEHRSKRFIHKVDLSVGFSQPKTSLEPVRASLLLLAWLQYRLEYKVPTGTSGILGVGGKFLLNYTLEYLPLWDDSHLFWSGFIGLGPRIRWEKPIREQNTFSIRLEFPLAGFLSRPPEYWDEKAIDASFGNILKMINSDMELVFINQYFQPSFEVGYNLKQSDHFTLGIHYLLDFLYAKSGRSDPYVHLAQGIGLKFIF